MRCASFSSRSRILLDLLAEHAKNFRVDQHAVHLHVGQHAAERHLDLLEDAREALVGDARREALHQPEREIGVGGGVGRRFVERHLVKGQLVAAALVRDLVVVRHHHAELALGEVLQAVALLRIEQVVGEPRVEGDAAER